VDESAITGESAPGSRERRRPQRRDRRHPRFEATAFWCASPPKPDILFWIAMIEMMKAPAARKRPNEIALNIAWWP